MFFVFLVSLLLAIITVIGDIFVKKASLLPGITGFKQLFLGILIYGATAFGWFFLMRKMKLSTVATVYSVSTIILLTVVGILFFKEKISPMEIIGICLAISSLVILSKFS